MIFFILHTNSFSKHSEISSPISPFCEGNISQKDLKEIDKFLWIYGKEKFPNKYY